MSDSPRSPVLSPRSLDSIIPSASGARKGFSPYRPAAKTQPLVERILSLYAEMYRAGALPIGPRQVGYRLTQQYGEYTKDDFPEIGRVIKRLSQSRKIPFEWVSDGASLTLDPGGFSTLAEFLLLMPQMLDLDRRPGQPLVCEVFAEARETLPLLKRLCEDRGVLVYSGSGSSGPGLARKVAKRALDRAVEHGQSTLFFAICDLDEAGIRNIVRPHAEHVSSFLFGVDRRSDAVLATSDGREIGETDATVEMVHLALTPEMARELEPDHADQIDAYLNSGSDLFERDLNLLAGVPKIELEALDPVALRKLVADALDAVLDDEQLEAVAVQEAADREVLRGVADLTRAEDRPAPSGPKDSI